MTDVDRVTAGAPVMWPAQLESGGLVHLARSEARRRSAPALLGMCPGVAGKELRRAPKPRWWRRRPRWCDVCKAYRDYLLGQGQL